MSNLNRGQQINNRYMLKRFVGQGSFGEVWVATDMTTNEEVALKLYINLDPEGIAEFGREFSTTSGLQHPNLLVASEYNVWYDRPYLVMKYCSSGSSSNLIGMVDEDTLWRFVHDVAAGLAYLHSLPEPIVHQDIKPDNILIGEEGEFLITDFGISKKVHRTQNRDLPKAMITGAVAYMGPERFGESPDLVKSSDIWSFGASIYELASGMLPFNGMGGGMQKSGADMPRLPRPWSREINQLISACLDLNTWNRPTAQEIEAYSSAILRGENPPQPWLNSEHRAAAAPSNTPHAPHRQPTPHTGTSAPVAAAAAPMVASAAPRPTAAPAPNHTHMAPPPMPQQPAASQACAPQTHAPQTQAPAYQAPQPSPAYQAPQPSPATPPANLTPDPYGFPQKPHQPTAGTPAQQSQKHNAVRPRKQSDGSNKVVKTLLGVLVALLLLLGGGIVYKILNKPSDNYSKLAQADINQNEAVTDDAETDGDVNMQLADSLEEEYIDEEYVDPAYGDQQATETAPAQTAPMAPAQQQKAPAPAQRNTGYVDNYNDSYANQTVPQGNKAANGAYYGAAAPMNGSNANIPAYTKGKGTRPQSRNAAPSTAPRNYTSASAPAPIPADVYAPKTKTTKKRQATPMQQELAQGNVGKVKNLADQGNSEACGALAEHYFRQGAYDQAEAYAKKAKASGNSLGARVITMLESAGYYD